MTSKAKACGNLRQHVVQIARPTSHGHHIAKRSLRIADVRACAMMAGQSWRVTLELAEMWCAVWLRRLLSLLVIFLSQLQQHGASWHAAAIQRKQQQKDHVSPRYLKEIRTHAINWIPASAKECGLHYNDATSHFPCAPVLWRAHDRCRSRGP